MAAKACDAVLIIGFGGPTRDDEVRPFLDNVLRGRPVPRERSRKSCSIMSVSAAARRRTRSRCARPRRLRAELASEEPPFRSTSGCATGSRTCRHDGEVAATACGARSASSWRRIRARRAGSATRRRRRRARGARRAPPPRSTIPGRGMPIRCSSQPLPRARAALAPIPDDRARGLIFTAHSIPIAMAEAGPYEEQLTTARMVRRSSGFAAAACVSEPKRQPARAVARARYRGDAAEPGRGARWSCRSALCAITSRCSTISMWKRPVGRAAGSGWSVRRPSATIRFHPDDGVGRGALALSTSTYRRTPRVAVVGGGISGLAAAHRLGELAAPAVAARPAPARGRHASAA